MPGHLDFEFDFRKGPGGDRVETKPFNLLVLGDFKGRGNGAVRPAAECRYTRVDLDNAEDLWALIEPSLSLELGPDRIEFAPRDIEHFHPDHLYRSLPVFGELRDLRKKLLDPETSKAALDRILSSRDLPATEPAVQAGEETGTEESADALFERLLGQPNADRSPPRETRQESDMLENFIQRLVAPHILKEPDPRADSAVASLDLAAADLMRQILHHSGFQSMEATWRSLFDLVSGAEWDEILQLYVCDVSRAELLNALPDPGVSLAESPLFEMLVKRRQQAADDSPWSVIAGDFSFTSSGEDIALLTGLGAAAAVNGAVFLGGASPAILGCKTSAELADAKYWGSNDEEQRLWSALRESPVAPHLGLALPRVLSRAPYGEGSEEIDSFPFEELDQRNHDHYLWANPAWHCARLLAQQFTENGWAMDPGSHVDLGDLPAHSYVDDGESRLQPCGEILVSESTMTAIFEQGLMPVVSYRNQNTAVLGRFQSVARPSTALAGAWARQRG